MFNPTAKIWTWVSGSRAANTLGVYGTQGVASTSNVPGSRIQAVSWIDKSGNFWLFGGSGIGSPLAVGLLNDLWMFNPTAKTWTWVSGSNTTDALPVYGTMGTAAASNVPGARMGSVSWADSMGNLWLFGGSGYDSTGTGGDDLNDLWRYQP
jgi:N-acetylneuraminic acid mutarotase